MAMDTRATDGHIEALSWKVVTVFSALIGAWSPSPTNTNAQTRYVDVDSKHCHKYEH